MIKERVNKGRPIYGVGINDVDYQVIICELVDGKRKVVWNCPCYRKWHSMLKRCYSDKSLEVDPTYKGCTVYEDWKYFSKFRAWMVMQEWEGRCLDKDFLVEGNKEYSPSTCVFVPQKVNVFINTRGNHRGCYPLGVSLDERKKKNPYLSRCNDFTSGGRYLGNFSIPEQAHQAWLRKKLELCLTYIEEFKDEPLITKGLMRIKDKIQHHIDTNTELKSF